MITTTMQLGGYMFLTGIIIALVAAQVVEPDANDPDKWDRAIQTCMAAAVLAFLAYFDRRISNIENLSQLVIKSKSLESTGTIPSLFGSAFPKSNRVSELKIFAVNSSQFLRAFREDIRELSVDKCQLIMMNSDESKEREKQWRELAQDGRISKLDITYYTSTPSSYYVIFDKNSVLVGGYYPKSNRKSGTDYVRPYLIRDRSVVEIYDTLFEETKNYYRN